MYYLPKNYYIALTLLEMNEEFRSG